MKDYIKYIFIFTLFILSLIYTNSVTLLARNNDPIMKRIKYEYNSFQIESVNAAINNDSIIPGINGLEIDINKSYKYMKKINSYNKLLLKYKDIIPEISISNIYNKYISSGNSLKRNISIVIYIKDSIKSISNIKDYKLNVFLDTSIISNNLNINNNIKIYNGGNNLEYNYSSILINNVIKNYNNSNYCININKNNNNLMECSRNKMYSISPNIIYNNFNDIINISNGSIIYFNESNIKCINYISNYLVKKGYDIVYLDELLSENLY